MKDAGLYPDHSIDDAVLTITIPLNEHICDGECEVRQKIEYVEPPYRYHRYQCNVAERSIPKEHPHEPLDVVPLSKAIADLIDKSSDEEYCYGYQYPTKMSAMG